MIKFFNNYDKVFLINLKKRTDRLENFKKQVEKFDLGEFEIFEAVDGTKLNNVQSKLLSRGEIGIIMSNIEIFKKAKEKNYKEIIIIEDDCYFTEEMKNIYDYISLIPSDWDMIYFGGNHNLHVGEQPPKIVNDKIIKLHNSYSAHFVIIKSNLFEEIIFLLSSFNKQIDVVYSDLQKKYNVYSTKNAIAKQLTGFSDIQNKEVDYNWLIK
jgi:GR25 family glycosyltransferase involved in LPS biosynthesis